MDTSVASVFDLSPADKLQLVEDLWDDLASCSENVPVQAWQIEELDRREAEMEKNPGTWLSWDEVKKNARSRYGR